MASDNRNSHASRWATSTPNNPPAPPRLSVADQLMQDPAAAAFQRQAQPLVDRLAGLPEKAANVLDKMHTALAENVELNPNLSTEGKRNAETELRRQALGAIDQVGQQAVATVRELEALINRATEASVGDSQAQLLAEMQLQRAWSRIQHALDSTDLTNITNITNALDKFVPTALAEGDRSVIDAIRAELPSYLRSANKGGLVDGLLDAVDKLEGPYLPAKVRAARLVQKQLDSGWPRLADCLRMANANASTGDGNCILPGWAANETLNLGSRVAW